MHLDYERANVMPIHKAKLMSYMKLMDAPIGLIINFHELPARAATSAARRRPGILKKGLNE